MKTTIVFIAEYWSHWKSSETDEDPWTQLQGVGIKLSEIPAKSYEEALKRIRRYQDAYPTTLNRYRIREVHTTQKTHKVSLKNL